MIAAQALRSTVRFVTEPENIDFDHNAPGDLRAGASDPMDAAQVMRAICIARWTAAARCLRRGKRKTFARGGFLFADIPLSKDGPAQVYRLLQRNLRSCD